jgi:hypothetical protein
MPLPALKAGDVVFTVDAYKTITHFAIAAAQRVGGAFGGGHANSIHPALATGNAHEVIESQGSGIRAVQLHAGRYRVFRYIGPQQDEIRDFATKIAESHLVQRDFTDDYSAYNHAKAFVSPYRKAGNQYHFGNRNKQFGEEGHAHSTFFCSNFIIRCFHAAAELEGLTVLPIPTGNTQLGPRELESTLIRSVFWTAANGGHSMTHP